MVCSVMRNDVSIELANLVVTLHFASEMPMKDAYIKGLVVI